MEVAADRVVNEPLFGLRDLACLILKDRLVVPLSLQRVVFPALSLFKLPVEQRVALEHVLFLLPAQFLHFLVF